MLHRIRGLQILSFAIALMGIPADSGAQTLDGGITYVGGPTGAQTFSGEGVEPCEGNNYAQDNYVDNCIMGGNMIGIEWFPSVSVTIERIEIFTGEQDGGGALAIWSNSGGVSRPLASLAVTSVFLTDPPVGWYGADLTEPLVIQAGTKYWVVWDMFFFGPQCSASDRPSDIQQVYWGSSTGDVSGGASWNGPFSDLRWKFRMFCGEEPPPVPAIGPWGGLLLASILLVLAAWRHRRASSRGGTRASAEEN